MDLGFKKLSPEQEEILREILVIWNCQPLCSECNFIKGTLSEEQLDFRLRKITEHRAKVDALPNQIVAALRNQGATPVSSAS